MSTVPSSPLLALDTLWFQVAGTLCNLQGTHCFISSSPTNHAFEMMSLADVRRYLAEAEALGVKEYYFTGGEPFLNRDIFEMIETALALGPVSVLTNGVLIREETAARLRALSDGSPYSLDLRIAKEFKIGPGDLEASVDCFNCSNASNRFVPGADGLLARSSVWGTGQTPLIRSATC